MTESPPPREPALKAVGTAIFTRRSSLGLRQVDLAEHCEFDRAFISYIEHGQRNPTLLTLLCIADRLNVKLSDLLRDAGL